MADTVEQVVEEILRLYPAVYRRYHASRRVLPGSTVTRRTLEVIQHLAAAGPLTVGELALHLRLSKAAATELVSRVEGHGLVSRMRDARDRRRVFIWLTPQGRAAASSHPEVLADDLLRKAVGNMQQVDRNRLVRGLRALLAAGEESS